MQLALEQFYQSIKKHINIIKGLGIIGLCSVLLSTCGSTYVDGFSVTSPDTLIVVKNTDIFKKCIPKDGEDPKNEYFIGVRCIFKGKAPDGFNITYAVWLDDNERRNRFYGKIEYVYDEESGVTVPRYIDINGNIVSREVWEERATKKIDKAISEFPESAWKTYTIDAKNRLEKYKGKTPDGQPMGLTIPIGWGIFLPSILPSLKDKTLNLDININKNGKVEVEEDYHWKNELPSNPYA